LKVRSPDIHNRLQELGQDMILAQIHMMVQAELAVLRRFEAFVAYELVSLFQYQPISPPMQ
jgi:hypothetical protein